VRASGRDVVTSGDILGVLISNTVGFALEEQGVTRHDLLSYISHGVAKADAIAAPVAPAGEASAVFILNDHFTPMEFVVQVLRDMFGLTEDDAERITRETHHSGRGACGVFPRAVAIDLVGASRARRASSSTRCTACCFRHRRQAASRPIPRRARHTAKSPVKDRELSFEPQSRESAVAAQPACSAGGGLAGRLPRTASFSSRSTPAIPLPGACQVDHTRSAIQPGMHLF
jgi:ATP-dependent Clp protease adapter protein ClpS